VYLQGTRIQSVYQQILAAGQLKEMTVKIPSNYPTPRCGEVRALRIVIDPQNQIREAADGDNTVDRPAADRPCPDVAIESIKKNSNAAKTEFVAEVKLVNLGNAHARFRYLATTGSNGIIAPLPDLDYDIVMELEPGQSKKFTVGSALGINNMHVMVMLDRMQEVPELNEGNNYAEKVLD
jgi:subtilase family serine protease